MVARTGSVGPERSGMVGRTTCPRRFPFDIGAIDMFASKTEVARFMRTSPIMHNPRIDALNGLLTGIVTRTKKDLAFEVKHPSLVFFTKCMASLKDFYIYPSETTGKVIVSLNFHFSDPPIPADLHKKIEAMDASAKAIQRLIKRTLPYMRSNLIDSNDPLRSLTNHANNERGTRFIEIQIH